MSTPDQQPTPTQPLPQAEAEPTSVDLSAAEETAPIGHVAPPASPAPAAPTAPAPQWAPQVAPPTQAPAQASAQASAQPAASYPPPPAWPPPTGQPWQPSAAQTPFEQRRPHRVRRGLALAVAAIVCMGAGAASTALAIGLSNDEPTATQTPTDVPSLTQDDGQLGQDGTMPQFPGSGDGFTPPDGQGGFGGHPGNSTDQSSSATDATAEESAGIVLISTTLTNGTAAGTGLVLASDGLIVTNHHVVAGATSIEVTVATTGETYDAVYIGGDATTDVAVLELDDASGLTTVDLSDDAAAVGDEITAVGDAGGDGGSLTAAAGAVTGLDESITVQSESGGGGTRLTGLVELDADIVAGDSGGAVLDEDGEVVGMNVAASSGQVDITGYAIPIDTVIDVVDQVQSGDTSGDVTLGYHGYLGIGLSATSDEPVVAQVIDGTPAAEAGITVGDTITSVGGTAVSSADALRSTIASYDAGESVRITWTDTSGRSHTATVTLDQAPVG